MTTYLISSKEMPFTARDIREALNLHDDRFDRLITAKIASTVIMCESRWKTCLRTQTWAVQRRDGAPLGQFFKAISRIGKNPRIGPAYRITLNAADKLGAFHDCTFEPDHRQLAKVKAMVVNWCWDEFDIGRVLIAERHGEFRTEWPDRLTPSDGEMQRSAAE